MKGKVKFYKQDKGFGFIVPEDGSADVFFHVSGVNKIGGELPEISADAEVEFETEHGKKGLNAIDVTFLV